MSKLIALSRSTPVALASTLVLVTACDSEPVSQIPTEAPPPTTVVVPTPVLDRAGLLVAIDRAASAYASGQQIEQEGLSGRRFLIRQAVGCLAPLAAGGPAPQGVGVLMKIENAPDLKLTLSPADWTGSLKRPEGTGEWEAAEGFWLTWPWMRTEGCPKPQQLAADHVPRGDADASVVKKAAAEPSQETATEFPFHTAGLAAVFEVDGSRLKRRMGRAYEYTLRSDGKTPLVEDRAGYRLVMEGRIAVFADGRSIQCRADDVDKRPVCVAAVNMERVAFETSEGQHLSEWRGG